MKKRINSIDIVKFIFSFFVIALHTIFLNKNLISNNRIFITIFHVAVPFFFITSGYLLFRKINFPLTKKDERIILKYIKHILKLYIIWTLIYLPISIYGAYIGGVKPTEFLTYSVRKFIFVGESYYSWNLWYLNGLIIAVLMVFILLKMKIKPKVILIIGFVVFLFGIILNYILNTDLNSYPDIIRKILNLYLYLFERVRNGIFKGFPYIAIGLYLSKQKLEMKNIKVYLMLIIGLILYYFRLDVGLYFMAIGVFLFVLNLKVPSKLNYDYFRNSSILIFLTHMIFVFIYLVFIENTNNFNSYYLFVFTILCCLIISTLIIWLSRKFKILNNLYK